MQHPAEPDTLPLDEQLDIAWQLLGDDAAQASELAHLLQVQDDPEGALRARTVLCAAALAAGQYPEALSAALALVDELREHADLRWLSRALNIAASASDALSQRDLAAEQDESTSEVTRELKYFSLHSPPLLDLGAQWFITDRQALTQHFRMAVEEFEQTRPEHQRNLAHAYVNLGILELEGDRPEEGARLLQQGRDLAHAKRDVASWVSAVSHLVRVHCERGDVKAARRELEGALPHFAELSGSARRTLLFAQLGVEYHAGEDERALHAIGELNGVTLTETEQQVLLLVQADIYARLGQYEHAYSLVEKLASLTKEVNKSERESQLFEFEEKYQTETIRREAVVKQLEAEAARREAEIEHLKNVELHRALESNAILIQSLRDSQLVSETLLGVSQLMQLDLDPVDLAQHAIALVTQVVDADWCSLACIHSGQVTFEPVWARNEDSGTFVGAVLPEGVGVRHALLHRSARYDEPTFTSRYERDDTADPALVAAGLRGFASLPAGTALDITYVLLLGRLGQDRPWRESERRVLGATGRSLRAAVETQERTRRSREAALTDVLTSLANRRAFEAQLREAAAGKAFSVAMLDLDGLKHTNDTRGHAAGDTLLQVFTANLRASAPREMQTFRLGGDEIALLMVHESTMPGEMVQEAVRDLLATSVVAVREAGFPEAGCSFGVAHWPEEARTPVEVVALADTRLYAEKQARRAHRRGNGTGAQTPGGEVVAFGDTVLDVQERELRGPFGQTKLSPREAELLRALALRSQQVVSRADLAAMSGLAGSETGGALDVHMSNMRRKLAGVTERAGIRTVRGQGFSLHWYEEDSTS